MRPNYKPPMKKKIIEDGNECTGFKSIFDPPENNEPKEENKQRVKSIFDPPEENKQRVDVDHLVVELDDWVKITTRLYKGKKWVDIRKFYYDRNDRQKKPSKKGITLAKESWERLREIEPLIDKALRDLDNFKDLNNK